MTEEQRKKWKSQQPQRDEAVRTLLGLRSKMFERLQQKNTEDVLLPVEEQHEVPFPSTSLDELLAKSREILAPRRNVVIHCLVKDCEHKRPAYVRDDTTGEWRDADPGCPACRERAIT